MIAEGWDLEDTTGKGARGELPAEAIEVEKIVGLFDSERASSLLWSADEFNAFTSRALTDTEIQQVRALRSALYHQWSAIAPGQTLELMFDPKM